MTKLWGFIHWLTDVSHRYFYCSLCPFPFSTKENRAHSEQQYTDGRNAIYSTGMLCFITIPKKSFLMNQSHPALRKKKSQCHHSCGGIASPSTKTIEVWG